MTALAPYAVPSGESGGRAHPEPPSSLRSPFELDRHRIIESTAFRRLEGKTQVFAPSAHDHFRTRLTHTLEVAQIARTLAAALRANGQLAEAIAFAHDLGHPPFGHAGEAALAELMADHGGFNHNGHAVRVVEYLEHPFPAFRGLNLTAQTLTGLHSHATPYDRPESSGASVEAQIASVADRIAYSCHDLEDGIGAGFITEESLRDVWLWEQAYAPVAAEYRPKHIHAVRRLVLDRILDRVIADVAAGSASRLSGFRDPQAVLDAGRTVVAASETVEKQLAELEEFLADRVYRHPEVRKVDHEGRKMVVALFEAYRRQPSALPGRFFERIDEQGLERVICDYVAGMTDRFCVAKYSQVIEA